MKCIRIFAAKHAGAWLELELGEYSIGANSDDDISITDWTAASLRLLIDANGNVCARLWMPPSAF
jgi:hypothetical protein